MSINTLLRDLSSLGIKLSEKEGSLQIVAPKGSLTTNLQNSLKIHKEELIELLQRSNTNPSSSQTLPTITHDADKRTDPFPMLDLQAAYLFGRNEALENHVSSHYYNEFEIQDLDVARFEQAWNQVSQRHQASLTIVNAEGQLQPLTEVPPIVIPVTDLREQPPSLVEAKLQDIRQTLSRQSVPLDRWPWFDIRITHLSQGRSRVHYNANNFFTDGLVYVKLLQEVQHYYEHPEQSLEPLDISFRDCCLALDQLEHSEFGTTSKQYWSERLISLPPPPQLPLLPGVTLQRRSRLVRRKSLLSADCWQGLKKNAEAFGVTPSNAVFTAYAEILKTWSHSHHFIVNSMVTRRFPLHPQIMNVLGNFSSMYPLEVDMRNCDSFAERAKRLQKQVLQDMEHFYYGGIQVLQDLNRVRGQMGRPACQLVASSCLYIDWTSTDWASLESSLYTCLETPQVQLDGQFFPAAEGGLHIIWDVMEEIFAPGLIDAIWQTYLELLQTLGTVPDIWTQSHLNLVPQNQLDQRSAINNTEVPCPLEHLQTAFSRQAQKQPDQLAVISASGTVTYGQLWKHMYRIGRRLQQLGVRPGQLVAIVMEKGWEQVAAVYGILASGAAYVPINPSVPTERLDYLLDNAQVEIVLTQTTVDQRLRWPTNVKRLCVDTSAEWQALDDSPFEPIQIPSDLAYVIYTSGSTGQPKGVMISHQAALNTIIDINRRFDLKASDRVLGVSALSFDLSVYDLFGPLLAGATLVLPDPNTSRDPGHWLDLIQRERITVWNSAPALMQLLMDVSHSLKEQLPSLRLVLMSGDWIPVDLPAKIWQVVSECQVISLGGATEASIWSIFYPINQVDEQWQSIPYGKPLDNQSWHVFTDDFMPCPTWVPGHLYIGGMGLALGYWRNDEKTRNSFVTHPITGERLYRTGDLGRYLPDGNIEFLGRQDFQVKVQGFRIELGEIESALLQHPALKEAVVTAHTDGSGGKRLIAYGVPLSDRQPNESELQDFLRQKLPDYMIPARVMLLDALPLTSNGKVNRKDLPSVEDLQITPAQEYVAPRTPIEEVLVEIWQTMLGLPKVGVRDDFFDLGGNSFTAVRVLAQITEQVGRNLPLGILLTGRTVEALANKLSLATPPDWSPLVPIHGGEGQPCFFIHPAGGNVLCYAELARQLATPFYGLQAPGLTGEQSPMTDITAMAELYITEIRQVQAEGPYILGGWSSGGMLAFEIARQLEAQGQGISQVILLDSPSPLQNCPVDEFTLLLWFLEDLNLGFPVEQVSRDSLQALPDNEWLNNVLQQFSDLALPISLGAEQLQPIFAVFKGIIMGGRQYTPEAIHADLLVLRAMEGCVSEFVDHPYADDPAWGWRELTQGKVITHPTPGNHYTILTSANLPTLVPLLQQYL